MRQTRHPQSSPRSCSQKEQERLRDQAPAKGTIRASGLPYQLDSGLYTGCPALSHAMARRSEGERDQHSVLRVDRLLNRDLVRVIQAQTGKIQGYADHGQQPKSPLARADDFAVHEAWHHGDALTVAVDSQRAISLVVVEQRGPRVGGQLEDAQAERVAAAQFGSAANQARSEEHTSELQ